MSPLLLTLSALWMLSSVAWYVVVPALAWKLRPWPSSHLRAGVILATTAVSLRLANMLITVFTLDLSGLMSDEALPVARALTNNLPWLTAAVMLVMAAFTWGLHVVSVPLAESTDKPAYPMLAHRRPSPGLALAAGVGLLLAAPMVWAHTPPDLPMNPALNESAPLLFVWRLSAALGGAVGGAMLWQGVAQRLLVHRIGPVGVLVVALATALPLVMFDHAAVAVTARLVVGLGLGGLAYRYSVEASIVAGLVAAAVTTMVTAW